MRIRTSGFTLIELLVVIAIIGILSSVVLVSLNSARIKARDAQRLSDVRQIRNALELYRAEHGRYPISTGCGATVPNVSWCNSVQSMTNGHWIKNSGTVALSTYLSADPIDPKGAGTATFSPQNGGAYFYFSNNGNGYVVVFGLEKYPNSAVESSDGVTLGGNYYHYGGSNGVITVGTGD